MKNKWPIVGIVVGLVLSVVIVGTLVPTSFSDIDSDVPPEFVQEVPFSHKTHVADNQIPCEFCHIYARRSETSGMPPMVSCQACHPMIRGSDEDPKREAEKREAIKKLEEFFKRNELIGWKKIHDLPDHVYFSHKRHISVGLDCTDCHGEISQLEVITPETMITDLSMGWCMKCHLEGRPGAKGKIIGPSRLFRGGKIIQKGEPPTPQEVITGPTDCLVCHK